MRTCVRVDQGLAIHQVQRTLEIGKLPLVLAAAAELPQINIDDPLEVLILMAREQRPNFDRAASRWVARLLAERSLSLKDARFALTLVERLPEGSEALRRLSPRSPIRYRRMPPNFSLGAPSRTQRFTVDSETAKWLMTAWAATQFSQTCPSYTARVTP